jgi:hypothetical protein
MVQRPEELTNPVGDWCGPVDVVETLLDLCKTVVYRRVSNFELSLISMTNSITILEVMLDGKRMSTTDE